MQEPKVRIDHYSDVLCVWAYAAQIRLDELCQRFDTQIEVHHHFITLFGDTETRIGAGWKKRGGFAGFGDHVREVCDRFDHVVAHADVWTRCQPATSAQAHLYLVAHLAVYQDEIATGRLARAIRNAFFIQARDVGKQDVLQAILQEQGVDPSTLQQVLQDGSALALLMRDQQARDDLKLDGSPTYVLNNGRQKLYGNVGYRVIEANVLELLQEGNRGGASWC